ncbi:MAG: extracellular solute-binding protein [Stigonema ocellatum SAG 48.90 = DSM 106950]|nr:extracellular solute-binding protein [Stigonema ocellatum SAG 48.90 = DSM 106950]
MERRSFLLGTGTLVLSQLLIGCGEKNQATLKVELLKDSIPSQVVNQFSKYFQQKAQLKFSPVEQLQDLFEQLQTWQKKTNANDNEGWRRFIPFAKSENVQPANLVTLGDYWISAAIQQKLIQPLEVGQLKHWSTLPKRWQEFVTRNDQGQVDAQGKVWGAPYRWGSTVIVYRRDKFLQEWGWTPTDWGDLWRSELQERISLLDQPREVIGLVLKKLGKSYNTENFDTVPDLEKELRKLNQQVKFYSSERYLEPLITGDTWLAVGWSNDVLPVLGRYPQLAAVIPQSGTAIWADLWVHPQGNDRETLSSQWIDFCWTKSIAKDISLFTKTNTPISIDIGASKIAEPLRKLLLINSEVFSKSEFLLPLPPAVATQYDSLFAKMKVLG